MTITREAVAMDLQHELEAAYRREAEVRRRFSDLLTPGEDGEPATFTAMTVEQLIAAQSGRVPWQLVRRVIAYDGRGIVDAVREVRSDLLRRLVEHEDTRSTSPVTMAAEQVDRDGVRRFIRATGAVERLSRGDGR